MVPLITASNWTSGLSVLGSPVSYPPATAALPDSMLDQLPRLAFHSCVAPRTADSAWSRLRQHSQQHQQQVPVARALVRVGILGCSTTSGCGSLEPSKLCNPELSWGRRMHDALQEHSTRGVTTNIFSKNAVEASFFWDCTRALLPPHAHILVLEVFQNMYAHASSASAGLDAFHLWLIALPTLLLCFRPCRLPTQRS